MRSRSSPLPLVTTTPTVVWELRKSGMRLTCSVRRTPEGLRLEESINEGKPFLQLTTQTEDELYTLAETVRQQDIEDGWNDAGN